MRMVWYLISLTYLSHISTWPFHNAESFEYTPIMNKSHLLAADEEKNSLFNIYISWPICGFRKAHVSFVILLDS
jgi:hypothetical protein